MKNRTFKFDGSFKGELTFSGDKSISHRAVMIASLCNGESEIENISSSEDVKSTLDIFQKLGVELKKRRNKIIINSPGVKNFRNPETDLYAGNSGTTARLLSGVLMHLPFETKLTGDASLSQRPMKRIIDPLRLMGANVTSTPEFTLPLSFKPIKKFHPVQYEIPVASAQVKSSILLAGLFSEDSTTIAEKVETRDHTERMLGLPSLVLRNTKVIHSSSQYFPEPFSMFVPGDISSAAFFIVAALLRKGSKIRLNNVSLNLTRIGFIDILQEMGGKIYIRKIDFSHREPFGDIEVHFSKLKNITIPESIIPNIIDEVPILAIAGLFAEGDFSITGVKELRVKESDRINAICVNLKSAGVKVDESPDGFFIPAQKIPLSHNIPVFDSFGDHRIAMSFAIFSLLLKHGGKINNFECVNISNPNFINQLKIITG